MIENSLKRLRHYIGPLEDVQLGQDYLYPSPAAHQEMGGILSLRARDRCIFCESMEGRLVIFLACVAVTLIVNTVIIWMVFKIFGNLAAKATEGVREFQTSGSMRQWLTTLQSASDNAVTVTGRVRDQIVGLEPALERMRVEHTERLAKADVRFKLVCRAIHYTAEKMESVVKWPMRNIHTASSIINGIFSFIRGTESDPDARSRRTR